MFSISELSLASCKGIELIRMAWLGIRLPAPFSSAKARLAEMLRRNTAVIR